MKGIITTLLLCWLLPATALELRGELTQGGLVIGTVQTGSEVYLDQQAVKVSASGVFAIGFDRDASAEAVLAVVSPKGQRTERTLTIKPRQYNIQYIEGISKKIMNPSAEALQRISKEAALVRQARAQLLERMHFAGEFQWPLKGPITGVFGSQRVYNGRPRRPHYGVDVAAPVGTLVSTPAPGVVTLAHDDMFYSGGTVIIDHGFGVSSTLMHLSKVLVNVGDEVKPGDGVAEVGAKGRATGPHLDWRMNWFKARIDPQLLVGPMPSTAKSLHGS